MYENYFKGEFKNWLIMKIVYMALACQLQRISLQDIH